MRKHRETLPGDPESRPASRQIREARDLDAAEIIEVAVVVAVVVHTVGNSPDLARDRSEARHEALPLRRDVRAVVAAVALRDTGDEERRVIDDARRCQVIEQSLVHGDSLHEVDAVELAERADRFGRDAELVTKRSG